MTISKKIKNAINYTIVTSSILNFSNYVLADKTQTQNLSTNIVEYEDSGRLNRQQLDNVIKYAHKFILENKDSIVPEKNESGFYRINLEAPDYMAKNLQIEKLRIHYWPLDKSNYIRDESIHDHPKYFESLIINGGYKHSIYSMNTLPVVVGAKKLNLVKINKNEGETKTSDNLGKIYVSKAKDEVVKEGKVVVMPTDVIHRVLFSVPGSLSINVVYKDKHNKDYYNVMLSENATENDIVTSRVKVSGDLKNNIINEIEKRLLNKLFQRN